MGRRILQLSLCCIVLCGLLPGATTAREGHWEPSGIVPSSASLVDVVNLYEKTSGLSQAGYAQRVERYEIAAGGERVTSERIVRGPDFRVRTTIDGGDFESGRDGGIRWRRTPNGLTRTISVDVQGDDLDRWPLADLPFAGCDCRLAGESAIPKPAWVIEYGSEHDVTHWFYIDKISGDLVRETWRDGTTLVTLNFDDVREVDGVRRPYHWVTSGSGQVANVTLLSVETKPVAESEVARPASTAALFDALPPGETELPVTFRYAGATIVTHGSLQSHPIDYILDSGTTQILVDGGFARKIGIHTFLGHGIAAEFSIGDIHLHNVAIQTTSLARFESPAIVGYELFANTVVHIDYFHKRAGVLNAVPDSVKAQAFRLDTDCSAAMPIVGAKIGSEPGNAFALDTGSAVVVVLRYFWEHDGARVNGLMGMRDPRANPSEMGYLEGPVRVDFGWTDMQLGPVKITQEEIGVERTNAGSTLEPPLDGIIGANVLASFDWWFDCRNHAVWFKPR